MNRLLARTASVAVLAALLLIPVAEAMTVERMTLGDLVENGHQIYRGTVVDSVEGTLALAGAVIPITTYRIRVDESFKGEFAPSGTKGAVVELRTLGKSAPATVGRALRVGGLPDVPRLEIGATYVLFTTRPAATGLVTTVGLGQGCFVVHGEGEKEIAVNELGNAGLFPATSREAAAAGSLPYARLAGAIRATLAAAGGGR